MPWSIARTLRSRRSVYVAIAVVIVICVVFRLMERSHTYSEAAMHYGHYARSYELHPDQLYISCYGERWDSYMEPLAADAHAHRDDRPYRMAMAMRFHGLQRKYRNASHYPWMPITLDDPLGPQRTR